MQETHGPREGIFRRSLLVSRPSFCPYGRAGILHRAHELDAGEVGISRGSTWDATGKLSNDSRSIIGPGPSPMGTAVFARVRIGSPRASRLGSHLERARPGLLTEPVDVARVYGEGGGGAHDPRMGARVRQLKDALKGKLDPLLEAWRDRAG